MLADLKQAVRSFRSTPAFTLIIIVTLALGIGANTAMFTVVNAVLLRKLPYADPDRLYRVRAGSSFLDMQDWRAAIRSLAGVAGFRPQAFDYSDGPEAERLDGALVTGDLLGLLGARLLAGRAVADADNQPGAAAVTVISERFWRTRLASDPAIVGRPLVLSERTFTIVGVLAPEFSLPGATADVIAALVPFAGREVNARGAHTLRAFVRIGDGASLAQAQQEMDTLAARLEQQFPRTNRDVRFRLVPLGESLSGAVRPALMLLVATVTFVLLIACVNVASLLIARGTARSTELAVRSALGAGPGRIVRLLLAESVLLAAGGGALGVVVGWWLVRAMAGLAPASLPDLQPSTLDVRVLGFTAVLSLGTGVLFGLLPAWTAASCPPADAMRTGGRATRRGERSRAGLMVAEIALALVLVVGAALLLRSFLAIVGEPPGFDTHGVLTANLTPGAPRYADIPTRTRFFADFESGVASIPGVRAVGLTTSLPIGGNAIFHNLAFEGRPMDPGTEPEVYYRGVNAAYFAALGIPLRRGRQFGPDDFRAGAPRVAIVNDAFTREYYPQEDPVGRRIRWASGPADWMTIVGVVADVRGLSLERDEVPAVHVPYAQEVNPWRTWMDVVVRTSGAPLTLAPAIRQQLSRLDRTVPLLRVRSMDDVLARSVAERRFSLYLLGGFALLALALSAAGTYGAVAYSVLQQSREIAIRIALGARRRDVLVLVVGRAVGLAVAGVAAGLALAFALSRALDGLLFGIGATDPAAFAAGALVLVAAAFAASYLPAHRAARIDPLAALRSE